jgi:hypothetical protein
MNVEEKLDYDSWVSWIQLCMINRIDIPALTLVNYIVHNKEELQGKIGDYILCYQNQNEITIQTGSRYELLNMVNTNKYVLYPIGVIPVAEIY